ncbi:hypothetical protein EDB19DRAFT_1643060 [Suillus lakei]|nr:hypothetical protein EDB19DRAFT_1643060 [Suillus lakei]
MVGSSPQSMPGNGGLQLTGTLGEVIRESAQIVLSWVKAHAYELGITKTPEEQFLTDRDIHVHMPEGSIIGPYIYISFCCQRLQECGRPQ